MCLAMNPMTSYQLVNVVPLLQIVTLKAVKEKVHELILVSPAMAAAAAIKGHFVDVRKLQNSINA